GGANAILSKLDINTGLVKNALEIDLGGSEFITGGGTDQVGNVWGSGYTTISSVQYPIFIAMNGTGGVEYAFKITNLSGNSLIKSMIRKSNENFFRSVGQIGNPSTGLYLKLATDG